jgi:periplasmic protein TonB
MRSFLSSMRAGFSRHRSELLSIAAHLCLLFLLFGGFARSAKVMPYRLPGTAKGVSLLTYYSPGSLQVTESKAPARSPEKARPAPTRPPVPRAAQLDIAKAAEAQAGVGTSAQSGLGDGEITIALQSYFPYPTPDLSKLPHGTKGDVILDAVIDEHGNITELTLLKGLGSPVDESVIETVQQWHYTPAMRKGVPVASEQELHFHYERRG